MQWPPMSMSEPPPPWAGSCRHAPAIGGYQQESWARANTGWPRLPSRMKPQRGLVLGVKAHHEGRAQAHPGLLAGGDHRFGIRHRQAQRLLAENMLARPRAGQRLLAMRAGRCGDVDRIQVRLEQFLQAARRPGPELLGHLGVGRTVKVENGDQLRIAGRDNAFGNGPPTGDAAGTDHAPFDLCVMAVWTAGQQMAGSLRIGPDHLPQRRADLLAMLRLVGRDRRSR